MNNNLKITSRFILRTNEFGVRLNRPHLTGVWGKIDRFIFAYGYPKRKIGIPCFLPTVSIKRQLVINGVPKYREGNYLCGTPYKFPILVTEEEISKAIAIQNDEFPHTVRNFKYNGLGVLEKEGFAEYKASFKEWTNDPGIFVAKCSDGKERLIPNCQIDCSFLLPDRPKQTAIFGKISSS